MIDLHLDMETGDPDDAMALCLLATHPQVNLRLVTLHPGGWDQVALVRTILRKLRVERVAVGGRATASPKRHVSKFHYDWLGPMPDEEPTDVAHELIIRICARYTPTLVTGAALSNIHRAVVSSATTNPMYSDWSCQGGFAGDNVVPEELRLEKFKGRNTCPTYNLNGDINAAKELLGHPRMGRTRMVSKNVCHGFWYDKDMHAQVPSGAHRGLDLLREAMDSYFNKHPDGKALHDVLAAVMAYEPRAGRWASVVPTRERGEWGSYPVPESVVGACRVLIAADKERVIEAMGS